MQSPMDDKDDWPILGIPGWVFSETELLAQQFGDDHLDVRFFRSLLSTSSIAEADLDRLIQFEAITDEADPIAAELVMHCLGEVAVIADAGASNPIRHVLHCGCGQLTDAFPKQYRNLNEALDAAAAILRSPLTPKDVWLKLDCPDRSWDTDAIRVMVEARTTFVQSHDGR